MKVSEIMEKRAAFSFEVFPPKTDKGMEKLCGEGGVLDHLYQLNPDYISCTYGAGGTNVGKNLEVLSKIKADGKSVPVTHFTCFGNTKDGIRQQHCSDCGVLLAEESIPALKEFLAREDVKEKFETVGLPMIKEFLNYNIESWRLKAETLGNIIRIFAPELSSAVDEIFATAPVSSEPTEIPENS